MPDIRKLVYLREESFAEAGRVAPRPIIRAVALILIGNPFAGRYREDLSPLVELGPALAARVAPELVKLLGASKARLLPHLSLYGRQTSKPLHWEVFKQPEHD